MEKKRLSNKENHLEIAFVFSCFFIYFIWSLMQPYNSCPDEYMRYDIPKFIFQHGTLPLGQDASLRNPLWGISYGFSSVLPAIISSVFMKFVSLFTMNEFALLMAARMVSVLASTGTVIVVIKLSKHLFSQSTSWVFVALVSFLPQFAFISTYVNNDALAIFSTALIVYFWVLGLETHWNLKSCVGLAIGISICLLTYYNAYGFILMSIVWFVCSSIIDNDEPNKVKKMFKNAAIVTAIVLVLAGWWFIRNLVLYGDLFATKISLYYSQLYAIDELKPSNRKTPYSMGYSIPYMLFQKEWLKESYYSFIGWFGYMSITLNKWMYWIYHGIFITGLLGLIIGITRIFTNKKVCYARKKVILYICMFISVVVPIFLSCYYSYTSDYEPQGRYLLPMLIPFMFLVCKGIQVVANFMYKFKDIFLFGIILAIFLVVFTCCFQVIPQNFL